MAEEIAAETRFLLQFEADSRVFPSFVKFSSRGFVILFVAIKGDGIDSEGSQRKGIQKG